jgi:multicomponent K+:H+ antiporter subunit G
MNDAIHVLCETVTAVLLIGGAAITLTGALGLLRLKSFYQRVHAPTLGTTLGTTCVALASIIHFSALGSGLALHELLIIAFVTTTTPIGLIVLVRAATFREKVENETSSVQDRARSAS